MTSSAESPFAPFWRQQGTVILDGGLATTIERHGVDLNDPLWSAKALLDEPETVRAVHRTFLEAGADCIATVTYQASLAGFRDRGLSDREGLDLLDDAVAIAVDARDTFWAKRENRINRIRPLVAASVGPYGAYLADGSEYRGDYDIGDAGLLDFHRARFESFVEGPADLIACETIPSAHEVTVLLDLLARDPSAWAWLSFSCRDGKHISDGTPVQEVAALCDDHPGVAALGVNCVPGRIVSSLISELRAGSSKPILVYPNSGESYDPGAKAWTPSTIPPEPAPAWQRWTHEGASGVGGCCRVGPDEITRMRQSLVALG